MNKICSLVVLYKGRELTQEAHDEIVTVLLSRGIIETPDDIQIRYYDSEGIANAIIANEHKEESNDNSSVTLHFVPGPNKVHVVKSLKEYLHIDLKEAKEIVDKGVITVNSIKYPDTVKELCKAGGYVKDLSGDIALQQAIIYINKRYPNAHLDKDFLARLIKDELDAKDSNADYDVALIESIKIIRANPRNDCFGYGLNTSTFDRVSIAYNVLMNYI